MHQALDIPPLFYHENAFLNFNRFKASMLGLHAREDDRITAAMLEEFRQPRRRDEPDRITVHHLIPSVMASWQSHSRSLFRLNAEVQAVLRETSLRGVQWGDILHDDSLAIRPYKSFALYLPSAIGAVPERSFNFITVSTIEEPGQDSLLQIYAFDRRLQDYMPLTKTEQTQISARCSNPKHRTWLKQLLLQRLQRINDALQTLYLPLLLSTVRSELVLDSATKAIERGKRLDRARRSGSSAWAPRRQNRRTLKAFASANCFIAMPPVNEQPVIGGLLVS